MKHLLIDPPAVLVLIRLTAPRGMAPAPSLRAGFFSRWRGLWGQREGTIPAQDASTVEEPLWIRTEQHHLG